MKNILKISSELGLDPSDFYNFVRDAIADARTLQILKSRIETPESLLQNEIKLTKYETLLVMLENETY